MSALWPFIGAWAIWLAGYGLLLSADYVLRVAGVSSIGVSADPLWVYIPVVVSAGAAAGFFVAAGSRWSMPWRLVLLALQVPLAYLAAVSLGHGYLCAIGEICS